LIWAGGACWPLLPVAMGAPVEPTSLMKDANRPTLIGTSLFFPVRRLQDGDEDPAQNVSATVTSLREARRALDGARRRPSLMKKRCAPLGAA